jgi:membrane-associated PAP2 superfamily phosphatase
MLSKVLKYLGVAIFLMIAFVVFGGVYIAAEKYDCYIPMYIIIVAIAAGTILAIVQMIRSTHNKG